MSTQTEFDEELDKILIQAQSFVTDESLKASEARSKAKQAIHALYHTREATLIREARIEELGKVMDKWVMCVIQVLDYGLTTVLTSLLINRKGNSNGMDTNFNSIYCRWLAC